MTEFYKRSITPTRIKTEKKKPQAKKNFFLKNTNTTCANLAMLWKSFLSHRETAHAQCLEVAIKL